MAAWAAALIAVTVSLDNLAVGVALGLRSIRVSVVANVVIAVMTTVGTGAAMGLGAEVTRYVPGSVDRLVAGLLLAGIGAWMTLTGIAGLRRPSTSASALTSAGRRSALRDPHAAVRARPAGAALTMREALVLGVALALNNIAAGVPAGAAGLSPVLVSVVAGLLSLLCVGGGARLVTTFMVRVTGRYAPVLAGVLLVVVGVVAVTR